MSYEVKGKLKKVLPVQTGTPKAGGEDWKKVSFVVANNEGYEGREQLFCFEIFGAEKVDNFNKFNKEGSEVLVKFEIRTNEYQGKYYTSLSAYRVESGERVEQASYTPTATHAMVESEDEDLPF